MEILNHQTTVNADEGFFHCLIWSLYPFRRKLALKRNLCFHSIYHCPNIHRS